ncbi:hypothetical protein [Marinicauda pacifica]|uniref:hypothetical protein n=1 Tax=Marinicauda pacifica TaxID=1133559 RepID=UPI0035C795D7
MLVTGLLALSQSLAGAPSGGADAYQADTRTAAVESDRYEPRHDARYAPRHGDRHHHSEPAPVRAGDPISLDAVALVTLTGGVEQGPAWSYVYTRPYRAGERPLVLPGAGRQAYRVIGPR